MVFVHLGGNLFTTFSNLAILLLTKTELYELVEKCQDTSREDSLFNKRELKDLTTKGCKYHTVKGLCRFIKVFNTNFLTPIVKKVFVVYD